VPLSSHPSGLLRHDSRPWSDPPVACDAPIPYAWRKLTGPRPHSCRYVPKSYKATGNSASRQQRVSIIDRKGFSALPAVCEELHNENADVRLRCCQFLDHFLTPEVLDLLTERLEDPDHRVRCTALHTLACDRCKAGPCRPDETRVLPRAIAILADDADPHVRAMAIEVVGRSVHTHPEAALALLNAKRSDLSATVRKKAGWYAPGGPIYQRTAPKVRPRRSS
jgi:hypothetical protein